MPKNLSIRSSGFIIILFGFFIGLSWLQILSQIGVKMCKIREIWPEIPYKSNEIDEQMEARSRVSRMEQKKDQVHVRNLAEKKSTVKSTSANLEDSDSSEVLLFRS